MCVQAEYHAAEARKHSKMPSPHRQLSPLAQSPPKSPRSKAAKSGWLYEVRGAFTIFTAVFVAEWADRTQIVMITYAASQPLSAVFLGSLLAFLVHCASAVLLAQVVSAMKISKRWTNVAIAVSFFIFSCMSIADGCTALTLEREGINDVVGSRLANETNRTLLSFDHIYGALQMS